MKVIKHLFLMILACAHFSVQAQVRATNDYGALGIAQSLNRAQTTASVMMIGAHPDDEDSALIAYLARGENARTAYLSLTRGDGGQNIIGPELFEALGVIRTEELLQARRLDGAEQYFTRAFDYGFSKTLAEARSKWDEKIIMCDAVRAIRHFRPLVVISRFSGTAADGHGQHQYAGFISPLAVAASSDPAQCTETGSPWTVKKFYVEQGFSDTSTAPLRLNTGKYDPILGRSYFELAIEGRSQHRSQGEGRLEIRGDQFSGLKLQGSPEKRETSPFDGLDTSIKGIAALTGNNEPEFEKRLSTLQTLLETARANYRPAAGHAFVPDLAKAYKAAYDAEWSTRQPLSKVEVRRIQEKIAGALATAAGIQIDPLSDRETVAPGESINISLKTFYPDDINVSLRSVQLMAACDAAVEKWCGEISIEPGAEPSSPTPGVFRRETARNSSYFKVKFGNVPVTQPYWLADGRPGDVYNWRGLRSSDIGLPFASEELIANVSMAIDDVNITFRQPVRFRMADPARGELRRQLNVVPPVTVKLEQDLLIVPTSPKTQKRSVSLSIINNGDSPRAGIATINGPARAAAKPIDYELARGARTSVAFELMIPAGTAPGEYEMPVSLAPGAERASTMHTIAYPHIQTHRYYTPATVKLRVIDLKTVKRKIGYIMGSGDDVSGALRQIGMAVTLLDEAALANGDLRQYDSIFVGIRATETRPDMLANRERLLEYVKLGGNLIVQYQRGGFAQSGMAPYPVDTADKQRTAAGAISRVVDEAANVTILEPAHPIFNVPNKITKADFEGWVQERNAYNLVTFDPKYVPLLESHDEGELENKGGLVSAKVGKGNWMYCSYSFFRQLPAGVPGAYRLFANIAGRPRGL